MARTKTSITKREQKQIDAVVNSHQDKLVGLEKIEFDAEAQVFVATFGEGAGIDNMENEDLDTLLADMLEAAAERMEEAGQEEDIDDGDDAKEGKTIVPHKYRNEYKARGDARCCGDWLAYEMRKWLNATGKKGGVGAVDLERTYALARANGCTKEWPHLNPGQQRMNAGNAIRRYVATAGYLTIPSEITGGEALKIHPYTAEAA